MESVIPLSAKHIDDPSSSTATTSIPSSHSSVKTIQIARNNNKNTNIITDYQTTIDVNDVNPPVLLNIFTSRKKRYRVFYNAGIVVWERFKSEKDRVSVSIQNIIAINPNSSENYVQQNDFINETQSTTEPEQKQFSIVYAERNLNLSNQNIWRYKSIIFLCSDAHVVQIWINTLQKALSEQKCRPKNLLVFVNPYGGKKRALHIYDKNVKPIFQMASIDPSVVISQRSNQIRDFIMTQSLEHFDGIVCIGGDGTFSEVFNGLIFRTIRDLDIDPNTSIDSLPKIKLPIGVIPAGSTDTVSYCLNGTTDICTNVLNIVLGQVNGMDLSSVSTQNMGLIKFYASVMSYGFLGDVAVDSEKYRWMGPKRYDYSGFKKLLSNNGYDGEIVMYCAPDNNSPLNGPKCLENCSLCENAFTKILNDDLTVINETNNSDIMENDKNLFKKNTTILLNKNNNKNKILKNIDNNCIDVNNQNDQIHQIKIINGKFFMVTGANISCACARSPNGLSKYCHLCDGYIDLILVRHTTFINNIKFILAMSSPNNSMTNLPQVEIYRTKKFSFRPNGMQSGQSMYNLHGSRVPISGNDNSSTSVWNCDGEVIHDAEVSIRSHRGLINVYRRGLFNANADENNIENNCCNCFG